MDGPVAACTALNRSIESMLSIMPLAELEKLHIERALAAFNHNHTRTAEALGIARSTLIRKLGQS